MHICIYRYACAHVLRLGTWTLSGYAKSSPEQTWSFTEEYLVFAKVTRSRLPVEVRIVEQLQFALVTGLGRESFLPQLHALN